MIEDGLGTELHDLGYLRGIFLFKEIEAEDGFALAGQLLDLFVDVLEEDGSDPFGLYMLLDAGFEVGQVVLAFALPGFEPEEVDGFIADDDIEPALYMFDGFHPAAGVEELIKSIGDDILRIGLRMDDIFHEIRQRTHHLIIHQPESVFIALAKGDDDRLVITAHRLFWFECLHA